MSQTQTPLELRPVSVEREGDEILGKVQGASHDDVRSKDAKQSVLDLANDRFGRCGMDPARCDVVPLYRINGEIRALEGGTEGKLDMDAVQAAGQPVGYQATYFLKQVR